MPNSSPNFRWLIVALLVGFTFLGHFNRVSVSVAANAHFIGPGKLSEQQIGYVYSAFLLVYTILMIPGGWLIDRIGPHWAMTLMGVGLGTCAALTGALGWFGLSVAAMFVPLLLIRGIAGASSVALHPGAARAVSLWLPLRERSTANGIITAGALVGIAVCYPGFGWLMNRLDWPTAFVVSGGTLAVFGLLWYVLAADNPVGNHRPEMPNSPDSPDSPDSPTSPTSDQAAQPPLSQEALDYADKEPPPTRHILNDFAALFRNRSLILITLSYGAIGYVQYMFFYWVEYYFTKVLDRPPSESREAAFIISISMAAGMFAGGLVSDGMCRWLGQSWGSRLMAMLGMGLSAVFCLLGISTTDPDTVVAYFALSLGAMGLCEGIFWTTAPVLEPRRAGLACALMNTGGNGVGMLAPVITPWIGKNYGWDTAVVVACCVAAVGAVLWLGIQTGTPVLAGYQSAADGPAGPNTR
jgi:ACS family D-galactonate transporter-like MFS transporter